MHYKKIMLHFLRDKGVVGCMDKSYIPQYCFPSDKPYSRNASTEEKDEYWKEVDQLLAANKERVQDELQTRANVAEIKTKNVKHVRDNLLENKKLFVILEIFQKSSRNRQKTLITADDIKQAFDRTIQDGDSTLEVFKEEFLTLVNEVEGLEHIRVDDFATIELNMWNNLTSNNQVCPSGNPRRLVLSKWKTVLSGLMCTNGKCIDPSCDRGRTDYHPIARSAFHGSHFKAENKTGNPSKLALKKDGSYFNEIVSKDIGVQDECSRHHDGGDVTRGESLPSIKYIKIIPSKPSQRCASDGTTNHLTLSHELNDRYRLLKHASYHIDTYLKGCYSVNYSCDYDTKRMSDYYHWSNFEDGDIVLTDDYSLGTAREWNGDAFCSNNARQQRTKQTLIRIMIYNSEVCYAADELVSEAAEERRKTGTIPNEDDFVCKPWDFCFRNLAPIEYGGISGDHTNDATKFFDPSKGVLKNIFEMYDELIECPWHCDFCHAIREHHQEHGSEERCYYLK